MLTLSVTNMTHDIEVAPQPESIKVGSRRRTFSIVGASDGAPGRTLVVVFHGSRQTGAVHREFTGAALDGLVDRGAVVAYLDGYRGNWNDARRESRFPARREGIDDVAFYRAVVERIAGTHGIDRARVVAVGYSNGGQMVFRLLHEVPESVAAAAVIAATMPIRDSFLLAEPTPAARPVPITLVHGTSDPIVPYAGGRMRTWARMLFRVGGTSMSAPATAEYFARRNGISTPAVTSPRVADPRDPALSVERTDFREQGLPTVTQVTVYGGGHSVPGPHPAPRFVGRTTSAVSIADLTGELIAAIH
jgi:polyhydroxybutyrate depolymerase